MLHGRTLGISTFLNPFTTGWHRRLISLHLRVPRSAATPMGPIGTIWWWGRHLWHLAAALQGEGWVQYMYHVCIMHTYNIYIYRSTYKHCMIVIDRCFFMLFLYLLQYKPASQKKHPYHLCMFLVNLIVLPSEAWTAARKPTTPAMYLQPVI